MACGCPWTHLSPAQKLLHLEFACTFSSTNNFLHVHAAFFLLNLFPCVYFPYQCNSVSRLRKVHRGVPPFPSFWLLPTIPASPPHLAVDPRTLPHSLRKLGTLTLSRTRGTPDAGEEA